MALTLSQSVTDSVGSELIGASVYIESHTQEWMSDQQIVWLSEHAPNEFIYAVRGIATNTSNFPTTIQDAMKTPYWPLVKQALEDEIRGKFLDNRAWDVVPRPKERKVVKSKWVLRFYQNQDGSIEQIKARLVACG